MHLQKNAFDKMYGIILNIDEQKNNQAFLFYKKKRLGKILSQWINLLRKVQEKELDLLDYERERRFEIAISKWNTQLMRKEQQRANVLRIQIEKGTKKRVLSAWSMGIKIIQEENVRQETRDNLLAKAYDLLDQLDEDSF